MNQTPSSTDSNEISVAQLQQYQHVYSVLTSKSEKLSAFRDEPHQIKLVHIIELHRLLQESCGTVDVSFNNLSILHRHDDGTSERWSSLEKLREIGPTISKLTSNLELTYSFLIRLPNLPQPGNYTVTIGVRNSLVDKINAQSTGDPEAKDFELFIATQMATARWDIEYVDISVARKFQHVIESWYATLPKRTGNEFRQGLVRHRTLVPVVLRVLSAIILLAGFSFLSEPPRGTLEVAERSILFVVLIYCAHHITTPFISWLKRKVQLLRFSATLEISRADQEAIERDCKNDLKISKFLFFQIFIPLIPSALIGLASAYFYLN